MKIAHTDAGRAWLPVGTRSLLYGAHQFVLHPLFLFVAWWQLYGFPRDPRLWVAFVVHDWGYWGKHAMDDAEGQRHPELGGRIMARLFGQAWGNFTRLHSRHYAKLEGRDPSPLAAADKLVLIVTPRWLYLPLVRMSGEVDEYLALFAAWRGVETVTIDEWYDGLRAHWADEVRRLAPGYKPRPLVMHRPAALLGALCGGLVGALLIRAAGGTLGEALSIGAAVGLLTAGVVLLWRGGR